MLALCLLGLRSPAAADAAALAGTQGWLVLPPRLGLRPLTAQAERGEDEGVSATAGLVRFTGATTADRGARDTGASPAGGVGSQAVMLLSASPWPRTLLWPGSQIMCVASSPDPGFSELAGSAAVARGALGVQ